MNGLHVRYCNEPAAKNGGDPCPGEREMFEDCVPTTTDPEKNPNCVLQGGWTPWSDPTDCSSTCNSLKTRTCTSPIPINSKECEGEAIETRLNIGF